MDKVGNDLLKLVKEYASYPPDVPEDKAKQLPKDLGDLERKHAASEKTTIKCGPDIMHFDQIRLDDKLTVTVTEKLVARLADARTPEDDAAAAVILAPMGAKPGGVVADTVQVPMARWSTTSGPLPARAAGKTSTGRFSSPWSPTRPRPSPPSA